MKMSLCKVHLGMFQYCLDGPQLPSSGLTGRGPCRAGEPCARTPSAPQAGAQPPPPPGSRAWGFLGVSVLQGTLLKAARPPRPLREGE